MRVFLWLSEGHVLFYFMTMIFRVPYYTYTWEPPQLSEKQEVELIELVKLKGIDYMVSEHEKNIKMWQKEKFKNVSNHYFGSFKSTIITCILLLLVAWCAIGFFASGHWIPVLILGLAVGTVAVLTQFAKGGFLTDQYRSWLTALVKKHTGL